MKKLFGCLLLFLVLLSVPCISGAVDIANCNTVCGMDTTKFRINNPSPGINVPLNSLGAWTPIWNAMRALGYSKQNAGEGGFTAVAAEPVQCLNIPCNFPSTGGLLQQRININWLY